jgi:hypothetical protein
MESSKLGARHGEAVRQAIAWGALVHMETAREAWTDAWLLCALARGLLQTWADTFPDPRGAPESGREVMGPAHLAGRFAGRDSLRTIGYGLHSARVWGALGSRVAGIAPAHGLS